MDFFAVHWIIDPWWNLLQVLPACNNWSFLCWSSQESPLLIIKTYPVVIEPRPANAAIPPSSNPFIAGEAWYYINYGKINVRKCNWGNSTSSPATLGKGGRSELMQRVDKRNRRAVAGSVLAEMLHFEQRDWRSAGTARQIHKSRASRNSPGRMLLEDISGSPWFRPQRAIGLRKWLMLNSCFDVCRTLWRVKKIEKKPGLSQPVAWKG